MDRNEASEHIRRVDLSENEDRAQRLVELSVLLPNQNEMMAFSGQAAQWLFDDIKATWLYGYFSGTILSAHAFCMLQLANVIRLLPDDPALPQEAESLEHLATIAAARGLVDVELQSHLVTLHDLHRTYTVARLHEHQTLLERHLAEADSVSDEHPLLVDARHALTTAIACARMR
jgi:hypothetical protein